MGVQRARVVVLAYRVRPARGGDLDARGRRARAAPAPRLGRPKPRCAARPAAAARSSPGDGLLVLVAPAPVLATPLGHGVHPTRLDRPAVSFTPGILARGPWQAGPGRGALARGRRSSPAPSAPRPPTTRSPRCGPRLAHPRRARRAARRLRAHDDGRLALELQPMRWSLRLVREDASASLAALCVVRDSDGRWLAGRRARVGRVAGPGAGRSAPAARSRSARTRSRRSRASSRRSGRSSPSALTVEALVCLPNRLVMLDRPGLAARGRRGHAATTSTTRTPGGRATSPTGPSEADRALRHMATLLDAVITLRRGLKYRSFAHSAVYIVAAVAGDLRTAPAKLVLRVGPRHRLDRHVAAVPRPRCGAAILPLWLGVMVAVIGGVGPFAGSAGFVVRGTPRTQAGTAAPTRYGLRHRHGGRHHGRSRHAGDGRLGHRGHRPGVAQAGGRHVAEDETLVEISTDKVDAEVPAPATGTVVKIHAAEGDTVDVGAVLAEIAPATAAAPGAAAPDAPTRRRASRPRSPTAEAQTVDIVDARDGRVGHRGHDPRVGQGSPATRRGRRDDRRDLHRQGRRRGARARRRHDRRDPRRGRRHRHGRPGHRAHDRRRGEPPTAATPAPEPTSAPRPAGDVHERRRARRRQGHPGRRAASPPPTASTSRASRAPAPPGASPRPTCSPPGQRRAGAPRPRPRPTRRHAAQGRRARCSRATWTSRARSRPRPRSARSPSRRSTAAASSSRRPASASPSPT